MNGIIKQFIEKINSMNEKEYIESMLTYNISPTIAGYKPSSIITFSNNNNKMYDLWIKYGDQYLKNISLETFILKHTDNVLIILFYYKENLKRAVFNKTSMKFLSQIGYREDMSLEECLQLLKNRYEKILCPHEMGIFLGIPVKNVESFIKCKGEKCLMCGYWKVYHNKDSAQKIFNTYNDSKLKTANFILEDLKIFEIAKNLVNLSQRTPSF